MAQAADAVASARTAALTDPEGESLSQCLAEIEGHRQPAAGGGVGVTPKPLGSLPLKGEGQGAGRLDILPSHRIDPHPHFRGR